MVYRVLRKRSAPSENCRLRPTPPEDFSLAASGHTGNCECTRRFFRVQGKFLRKIKTKNSRLAIGGTRDEAHLKVRGATSRKQAADEGGFGDTADGENHGTCARGNMVLAHGLQHLVKGAHHDLLQAH